MALVSKKISLVIKSEHIIIDKLKHLEKYGNIKLYKKGQKISEAIPILEKDIFKFSKDLGENIENCICEFLDILISKLNIEYLHDSNNDVELRLYFQSFEAQINFSFSPRIVKLLNKLEIDLQIDILSWGEVLE